MSGVLVTGCAGYIGSVLVRQLLSRNYSVIGLDNLSFGGESLLEILNSPNFRFVKGDIRDGDCYKEILNKVDSIIHLAAIVGDPACAQQPQLAKETNWHGSKLLYDSCIEQPNIKRFVFASTCSNYGKMNGEVFVNENSELRPISLYAKLKVKFEQYLLASETRADFTPTVIRFATVYGTSPRMRFDLTVNEFVREVAMGKELQIYGAQFWRPYCHVNDLATACVLVLESATELVRHEVFGAGSTNENYQKETIANMINEVIAEAKIKYVHKYEDPRDYRVEFSKIENELGFKITRNVMDGIKEIYKLFEYDILIDPYSGRYKNI